MSPAQSRAARGLINWSQETLAARASVSVTTLRNFERGATVPVTNNLAAIRAALEAAGVQFIEENGGGPGVRLRQPSTSHVADPQHPELRSVGPEDEDRAGPEAPEG
jgi:transcriptional regulator with XRE-family HTH domain